MILVVGGGLTGSAIAARLGQGKSVLWEAGSALGGRMGALAAPRCQRKVDIGAQYISHDVSRAFDEYAVWTQLGLLRDVPQELIAGAQPPPEGVVHLSCALGMHALVDALAVSAGLEPQLNRRLASLTRAHGGGGWVATDQHGREEGPFEQVVLALPAPALQALGFAAEARYSQRYCLGVFMDSAPPQLLEANPWSCRYVRGEEDDAVRFLSFDQRKRGLWGAGGPVDVVVHSSVPYAVQALAEGRPEAEVQADLLARATRLLGLPGPGSEAEVVLHCWEISQAPSPGPDAAKAVAPAEAPGVVLAGDSFSGSGVDNCLGSVEAAMALLSRL